MTEQEFNNLNFGDVVNNGTNEAVMINERQFIWKGSQSIRTLVTYKAFSLGPISMAEPELKRLTVGTLIEELQKFPEELPVAFDCYSEHCLLLSGQLRVERGCLPRDDHWVQRERPDMISQDYLIFPGN